MLLLGKQERVGNGVMKKTLLVIPPDVKTVQELMREEKHVYVSFEEETENPFGDLKVI
jgi:hypothetical protein